MIFVDRADRYRLVGRMVVEGRADHFGKGGRVVEHCGGAVYDDEPFAAADEIEHGFFQCGGLGLTLGFCHLASHRCRCRENPLRKIRYRAAHARVVCLG